MAEPVISVHHLSVEYRSRRGTLRAVEDVSLDVMPGEVVGLAGESGSGKSTMALAVTRLIKPPAEIAAGDVQFRGMNVLDMSREDLRRFRWSKVSLVFQSAMNSLSPVLTIRSQFDDMFLAHDVELTEAREREAELMRLVRIDPGRLTSYPHELSGGMRQRIIIAMALALHPELVIMDEPTTALDVVVEQDIIAEIQRLQAELGFAVLFITHDLALLSTIAQRIAVMYAGKIVEQGDTADMMGGPHHPYTRALIRAFPRVRDKRRQVLGIPGNPPDMRHPPTGCRFHPRCPEAFPRCSEMEPVWTAYESGAGVMCHLAGREGTQR